MRSERDIRELGNRLRIAFGKAMSEEQLQTSAHIGYFSGFLDGLMFCLDDNADQSEFATLVQALIDNPTPLKRGSRRGKK